MKKEKINLEQVFEKFESQWDFKELNKEHDLDFMNRLSSKSKKKSYTFSFAIAASIAILIGFSLFYQPVEKQNDLQFASKETKRTDSIFTVLIENQLIVLKEKKSNENQKIVADALKQMKVLDADYEKIVVELQKNGESKQIIYALISNFQIRISFLQEVLKRIDENEKLNEELHEKTI